jgi:hypothetical protein
MKTNMLQNIGALWVKNGKKGKFYSGTIEYKGEKIRVMAFPNTKKTELKHPDLNIVLATDETNRPADADRQEQVNGIGKPDMVVHDEFVPPAPPLDERYSQEIKPEDIPF